MSGVEGLHGLRTGFTPGHDAGDGGVKHQSQQQQGAYRGESVKLASTPQSILQNAAEELSIGLASKMNKKDIGERKVDGRERPATLHAIEKIQDYLDKLPDLDPRQLKALLEQMKQHGELLDEDGFRQALSGFHDDITYQQAALDYLASELEESGDAAKLLGMVHAALVENERTYGPEIRAGLNVTGAAFDAAATPEDVQGLRNFYREAVVQPEGLKQSFETILKRAAGGDFDRHIGFMIKAVGDDLASQGPSASPVQLKLLLDNVYALELLRTLRESGGEMLALVDRSHGLRSSDRLDDMIAKFLDKAEGGWVSGREIAQIASEIGVRGTQAEILFLTELGKLARSIPEKAHHDPAKVEQLRDAIQDALNEAIEREEAEEATVH